MNDQTQPFKAQVWHLNREMSREFHGGDNPDCMPVWPMDYSHVANVEVLMVGDQTSECVASRAFELTNHIDTDWTTNPGVVAHGHRGHRSTSVGDVVVLSAAAPALSPISARLYCAPVGWRRLQRLESTYQYMPVGGYGGE
jgi:hypothetical protein